MSPRRVPRRVGVSVTRRSPEGRLGLDGGRAGQGSPLPPFTQGFFTPPNLSPESFSDPGPRSVTHDPPNRRFFTLEPRRPTPTSSVTLTGHLWDLPVDVPPRRVVTGPQRTSGINRYRRVGGPGRDPRSPRTLSPDPV